MNDTRNICFYLLERIVTHGCENPNIVSVIFLINIFNYQI